MQTGNPMLALSDGNKQSCRNTEGMCSNSLMWFSHLMTANCLSGVQILSGTVCLQLSIPFLCGEEKWETYAKTQGDFREFFYGPD